MRKIFTATYLHTHQQPIQKKKKKKQEIEKLEMHRKHQFSNSSFNVNKAENDEFISSHSCISLELIKYKIKLCDSSKNRQIYSN